MLEYENLTKEKRREYIRLLGEGCLNLTNLIDDIIDFAKIESGEVKIEKKEFNPHPIMEFLHDHFTNEIIKRNKNELILIYSNENKDPDSKIRVSEKAAGTGENIMGITEGEVYTLEELMYGLLLPSGNDAAYAIAEGVAGSSDRFVEWMNFKAKELGLMNTYFADPSGLDDTTYSTAQDLARLARYAMKNPRFRSIVGTVDIELPFTETHKYLPLYNQTNLLATYPGVVGVKTGYTEEAGLTLVTYASNEGYELVGVVLNSTDRKGDMVLMLDHGYGTVGVAIEHNLL